VENFRDKLKVAWDNAPPRLVFLTRPMPNAPNLYLSGSGFAIDTSIESFIQKLERDKRSHSGKYFAYVMEGCKEEADTYFLEGWEVLTGDNSIYEYTIVLYYSAINPYLTIKKWMGEDIAQEYLARQVAVSAIASAFV